ncbi:hypothetical protein WN944_006769 [Citrus x changshan-huyou]|uniref:Uncharacterized protein n=1 Tax=Citrus x changshan-huyou TaxID=2935761 RepID=A0AAP0QTS9_9ROSI
MLSLERPSALWGDFLGGDLAVSAFADLSFDLPLRWFREKGIHGHLFACAGNVAKLIENEYLNFSLPKFLESNRSSAGAGIVFPTNLFRLEDLSSFGLTSDLWQPLEFDTKPINFSPELVLCVKENLLTIVTLVLKALGSCEIVSIASALYLSLSSVM